MTACPLCLGHGEVRLPALGLPSAFGVLRREPPTMPCPACSRQQEQPVRS